MRTYKLFLVALGLLSLVHPLLHGTPLDGGMLDALSVWLQALVMQLTLEPSLES
jgi:hypothetical protein